MAKNPKQQAAIAMSMKAAGKKPKMQSGGSLKAVDSSKNPGLSKLPTEVRNKMGYQKKGGAVKKYQTGGISTKPMSDRDFRNAKKATRQSTKLSNISKRGSGSGIDKAAKIVGAISSGIGAAAGIKRLVGKDQTPSFQSGPPMQKKGGAVKSKKK